LEDQHILGYFYEPALALQKDYATKLLGTTNRFNGLPLARDPAVAFVEIINENGIIQKWFDGALDALPARYATNLQARWNSWLAARIQRRCGAALGLERGQPAARHQRPPQRRFQQRASPIGTPNSMKPPAPVYPAPSTSPTACPPRASW
jgi:hypothetical protein